MLERVNHSCSWNREFKYIESMRRILLFQKTIFSKFLFVFSSVSVYHLLAVFLEVPILGFITDGCVWFEIVAPLNLVSEGRHQSSINITAIVWSDDIQTVVSPGERMPCNHDGGDIAAVCVQFLQFFLGNDWSQGSQLSMRLSSRERYFSSTISISILTNRYLLFNALVWFSSKPIIHWRFFIQEVDAAL